MADTPSEKSAQHTPLQDASMFAPNHCIGIRYPVAALLLEDEELAFPPISESHNRYEPKPLIGSPGVAAHSFRGSLFENEFVSITPARIHAPSLDSFASGSAKDRLIADMKMVKEGHGRSMLQVVTFMRQVQGFGEPYSFMRLRRETIFFMDGGKRSASAQDYEMPLHHFDEMGNEISDAWMLDLRNLVLGISNRAVLHMYACYSRAKVSNPAVTWRPERHPRFEEVMDKVAYQVPIEQLAPAARTCVACLTDFDDEHLPFAPHCDLRHTICMQCLLQWCQAQDSASSISCPHCRSILFKDRVTLEWLTFGVAGKSYEVDSRFDEWENWERSCSDLDLQHAKDNDASLTVNAAVFSHVWSRLVQGAKLESAQSSPAHLQVVRSVDWPLIDSAFQSKLRELDGITLPTKHLHTLLVQGIHHNLLLVYLRSGLHITLSSGELSDLTETSSASLEGRKSEIPLGGFFMFVSRALSRMLQFAHLRLCQCEHRLYHYHGLREYWNPDFFEG